MRKYFFIMAAILASCSPGFAWNKVGHWTVASIAYGHLNETSAGQMIARQTATALRFHPAFEAAWKHDLAELYGKKYTSLTSEEVDYGLFLLAASWPDDLKDRSKPQYQVAGEEIHGNWHYINQPYPPDANLTPEPENLKVALTKASNSLNTADGDAATRAIALCWVLHLVGDVHQPLHTISWMTPWTPAPQGDAGGNKWIVRVSRKAEPKPLHAYWDDMLECPQKVDDIQNATQSISQDHSRKSIVGLENATLSSWLKRSYSIAVNYAYLNGKLKATLADRKISYSREREEFVATYKDAAILTPEYQNAAQNIGREQIALAGYQLARLLETYKFP